MSPPLPPLAVFDLDRTLIPLDSELSWVSFLVCEGLLDSADVHARSRELTEHYNRGEAGAVEMSEFYLSLLRPFPIDSLAVLRDRWIEEVVRPAIPAEARALVEGHRLAGHECVVTTATFRYLAEREAAEFGDVALIATEEERRGGRFTGRVRGLPNAREGKVDHLLEWLGGRGLRLDAYADVYVYTDSSNDLPLLSHATQPVAVNPDPALDVHARHAGWRTLALR